MSHNFLFDTYDYIHKRLAAAEQTLLRTGVEEDARHFAAGQVELLCEFERFLRDHVDPRLPRRLRNRRQDAPGVCKERTIEKE